MSTSWLDPLEKEEEEKIISDLAKAVGKRELETPAILFLDMHKPLAYMGGHAMVATAPFVAPFLGTDQTEGWSRLMATPGGVERLIQKLEEQRAARGVEPATPSKEG
jgi:hypothetical protein